MLLEMEGGDGVLAALEEFSKKPSDAIPTVLEEYLIRVSKTGETQFPWAKCKILIQRKVDDTMKMFNAEMPYDGIATVPNAEVVRFDDLRRNILAAIDSFAGAPFTIQRLCELVTDPRRHYTRTDKFLRGLEKNVQVVTTVDPWGRKISSDRSAARALVVNGMSPSGVQHSSAACTPLRSPAAAGPSQDSAAAAAALCQAQGDAVVKDDACLSLPAQDSPISNGSSSSSSSSSSSISSFEAEHTDCDDARAAGVGSTADADVGSSPGCLKTDGASVTGVKRPSTDSLLSIKSVPAKQPREAARVPESDAANGAAASSDGDEGSVSAPSSEPADSTTEITCASDGDVSACVTASTGDATGSGASDTRLGASDSDSAESLRPTPVSSDSAVTKAGLAEHDSGVVSCGKPAVSTARTSAKGDGDSAEAAVAAAPAAAQAAEADGSPVDGGDSGGGSGGSPSKLCCPPPLSSAASLVAAAAVSDST